ncbi:phosphatidylinositol kinase- protein kinase tor1, partial [Dispira parvispora]
MGVAPGLQSNQFSSSILSDLRSRDHIPRKKAMQELRDFVNSLANDAYSSNMRVLHDVKRKISDLPNSSEATDKLAGAAALEITIPLFVDEDSATLTRYNYTLQRLLQVNDILVVQHAVKATVNLINISGALAPSLLEMIITNALEWLQGDRTDTRRHAAVLLIRELASQMPNSVYSYVNQALEAMWGPLRDSKSSVRQVASEALGALLEIIEERETPFRLPQLSTLYEEAQKGVKMGTLECLHSSLLVFQQLLRHSGMFMSTHYPEVALLVCKLKDHRDFLIRQAAVTLVEILAEYSPSDFRRPLEIVTSTTSIGGVVKESPMEHYVPYLLTLLKKEKERALAYTILGKIALVVRNDFKPYVQPTLQQIKESLANKTKYRITTDVEAAIMQCLSHFAEALGPVLTKYLHDSLDLLFLSGLNPSLKRTLTNIAKNVSQLLPAVQSKLLDELSLILAGQPYVAPGVYLPTATSMSTSAIVTGTTTATAAALTSSGSTGGTIPATATSATGHSVQDHQDPALLILALQTLGEFNFQSHNLTEFVRDYVLDYLDSDNQEVRIATAVAVNRVFDKDKICQQRSQHSVEIVNETLQYLLSVAIADASHQVRMATLQTLSPSFDQQLSNSNNVRAFSLALNDEALDIRLAAIAVLGRLIPLNPAQVLPFLRRTLLQVLTELECASLSRVKEECCRVIYQLALHAQQWIRAYVVPIYRGLFSKIRDSTSGVSIAALQAMSEITRAGGEDLSLHLSELVPVIIDILQDPVPSPRRLHALRTLGNLGTYAGVVITPYTEYPQLMGTLLSFLKDDKDPVVRRETFRVMGTLGAVDPYQYRSAIRG